MISCLLSIGYQSIDTLPIGQDHVNKQEAVRPYLRTKRALNGINQKSSAEYNFFLMVFGLAHRAKREQGLNPIGHLSARFAEQVEKVARRKNKPGIMIFDQVVNGKGPGIDWPKVNPNYTDYLKTLDSVNRMVDEMTKSKNIRESEVKRLREFAKAVIDYRSNLPISAGQAPRIARWISILSKLDEILSEPDRFGNSDDQDKPEIDLYEVAHEYLGDFDEFEEGPSIFSRFNKFTSLYNCLVPFSHTEVTIDEIPEGVCMDVPGEIKDKSRAINTHNKCVILYYDSKCQGRFRVFTPDTGYHENFSTLGFSRGPRSMKLC